MGRVFLPPCQEGPLEDALLLVGPAGLGGAGGLSHIQSHMGLHTRATTGIHSRNTRGVLH